MEIADKINEYYIFEDVANQLSKKLKSEIDLKTFDNLTDAEFAKSLSSYLTKNGNDLHFNVLYRPGKEEEKAVNEKELLQKYDAINKQWNYGFDKVMRLDGNIGYIEYTGFPEGNKSAQQILDATMNFVSNTNALIIDLRNNRGGDGKMVRLFLSYFFNERIKLSEIYTRYNNKTEEKYTFKKVNGKKYLDKPVYLIVNNNTISAAEALAYNLQQNKIAKVIGDKTYGAANPVKVFFIGKKYQLFIPISVEKNAVTKTNWEHTGINVDEKVNSEKALIKAQIIALENLLKSNTKTELTENEIKEKILKLEKQL
nr:S41 family peptidase [Pedobacter sp. ASV2]